MLRVSRVKGVGAPVGKTDYNDHAILAFTNEDGESAVSWNVASWRGPGQFATAWSLFNDEGLADRGWDSLKGYPGSKGANPGTYEIFVNGKCDDESVCGPRYEAPKQIGTPYVLRGTERMTISYESPVATLPSHPMLIAVQEEFYSPPPPPQGEEVPLGDTERTRRTLIH